MKSQLLLSPFLILPFRSTYLGSLYYPVSLASASHAAVDQPSTQNGHSKCALFTLPQAEHLFKAVTSFNALPARNLCRFFLCDVFFFGTARSIDSHSPLSIEGSLKCDVAGNKKVASVIGRMNCSK